MAICKIGKYENYSVKEVINDQQTGKTVVKIAPTANCPDGVFISGRTVVQKDSSVSSPTLMFSTKLNAPVVLMPTGATIVKREDPTDIPKASHLGFFGWILILAFIVGVIWLIRKIITVVEEGESPQRANEPTHESRISQPTYRASERVYEAPRPAPTQPLQPQATTTIINNTDSGSGLLNTMTAYELGRLSASDRERVEVYHDREVIHEKETIREETRSDNTEEDNSVSSDDDSSVSGEDDTVSSDDSSFSGDDDSSFSGDDN